jgi:hypothetical protein
LIVGDSYSECSSAIEAFLAPRIWSLQSIDRTIQEFAIDKEDSNHYFRKFLIFVPVLRFGLILKLGSLLNWWKIFTKNCRIETFTKESAKESKINWRSRTLLIEFTFFMKLKTIMRPIFRFDYGIFLRLTNLRFVHSPLKCFRRVFVII